MTTKSKVLLVVIAIAVAFAFGRWSTPEKVKIETKIVEVEKKVENKKTEAEREKHKETIVTERTLPDGTKEVTTRIIEDSNASRKTDGTTVTDSTKTSEKTEERTRGSGISISALAGRPLNLSATAAPIYGGHVSKEILGPITAGAWALSNSTGGVSLGLRF